MPEVLVLDSATQFDERHVGNVVITGSHGGVYPGYLAAKARVLGVTFNDAGVGKDQAGIASLPYLDQLGIPAATIGYLSARIADGADIARRGIVSRVNETAKALGCAPGQPVRGAAQRMKNAVPSNAKPPAYAEARMLLRAEPGEPEIWGIDSAALMNMDDGGRIMITGSHGALLAGRPDHIVKGPPLAAFFNDAGIGVDEAGISRLPSLDALGVIGATVATTSARIGDARSAWETGLLSHINRLAAGAGAREGTRLRDFVLQLAQVSGKR